MVIPFSLEVLGFLVLTYVVLNLLLFFAIQFHVFLYNVELNCT